MNKSQSMTIAHGKYSVFYIFRIWVILAIVSIHFLWTRFCRNVKRFHYSFQLSGSGLGPLITEISINISRHPHPHVRPDLERDVMFFYITSHLVKQCDHKTGTVKTLKPTQTRNGFSLKIGRIFLCYGN